MADEEGARLYPPLGGGGGNGSGSGGGANALPSSTERAGKRTACVALSATGAAVLLGVLVSLAVGPGVADAGAAAQQAPPPLVRAMDGGGGEGGPWYDCPPGVSADSGNSVSFLVLGDWGRQGNANQRRVSDAMADVSACLQPRYVVSTGDNWYPSGLYSADDEQFQASFANVYGREGGGDPEGRAWLSKLPFYAALGNHDVWEGKQRALRGRYSLTPALEASARNGPAAAGRWHCYNGTWAVPDASRGVGAAGGAGTAAATSLGGGGVGPTDFAAAGLASGIGSANGTTVAAASSPPSADQPLLDLIVIDTNPFMDYPGAWTSDEERDAERAAVRQGLERRLRASRAAWQVVAGHHPVHSLGEHCNGELDGSDCGRMTWLAPLLREHGVAAYLAGHEHDLQLIFEREEEEEDKEGGGNERWPAFVVSGGGSNVRENEFRTLDNGNEAPVKPPPPGYAAPFVADQQGFVAAVVNSTHLSLHYYALSHRLPSHTAVLARRA
jgi:tartrate-resistant acid phosphatase type 5